MRKLYTSSPRAKLQRMKNTDTKLTVKALKELKELGRKPDEDIDVCDPDAPEITDWTRAERGKFYRPVKQPISLRVDADVLTWFRSLSDKYQSRMNQALREYMEHHQAPRSGRAAK